MYQAVDTYELISLAMPNRFMAGGAVLLGWMSFD
jgi:hypothetical protein